MAGAKTDDDMTAWIHLRVHAEARDLIRDLAKAAGVVPSKFVRTLVYRGIGLSREKTR